MFEGDRFNADVGYGEKVKFDDDSGNEACLSVRLEMNR